MLARMGAESGSSRGGDMREVLDGIKYRIRRRSRAAAAVRIPRARAS
jgi:hypothetical protein